MRGMPRIQSVAMCFAEFVLVLQLICQCPSQVTQLTCWLKLFFFKSGRDPVYQCPYTFSRQKNAVRTLWTRFHLFSTWHKSDKILGSLTPKKILTLSNEGVLFFCEGPKISPALIRVQLYLPFLYEQENEITHKELYFWLSQNRKNECIFAFITWDSKRQTQSFPLARKPLIWKSSLNFSAQLAEDLIEQ